MSAAGAARQILEQHLRGCLAREGDALDLDEHPTLVASAAYLYLGSVLEQIRDLLLEPLE